MRDQLSRIVLVHKGALSTTTYKDALWKDKGSGTSGDGTAWATEQTHWPGGEKPSGVEVFRIAVSYDINQVPVPWQLAIGGSQAVWAENPPVWVF